MIIQYINGKIIREGQIRNEDVWVQEGKIIPPAYKPDQVYDLQGHYLAPGYIDLQINGGFGVDFTTNLADVGKTAKELLKHGVTSFLPTILSSTKEHYHSQLVHFKPKQGGIEGASILGLHLEGPFFNPQQCGAHNVRNIKNFQEESLESLYGSLENVKMITLAPEIPGALNAIKALRQKKIIVAAGHSHATEEEFVSALQAGVSVVTHLFNAMTPFHHRATGIVSETLGNSKVHFSIISDGVHVNDRGLQIAWKMNPEGLFLISDAIALFGTRKTNGCQAGMDILADAKKAYVAETGRLAGGLMGLDGNVRHLHVSTGCSIAYAVEAASTKPAKILGIDTIRGTLNVGSDADMIILNDRLQVLATFIRGERVW